MIPHFNSVLCLIGVSVCGSIVVGQCDNLVRDIIFVLDASNSHTNSFYNKMSLFVEQFQTDMRDNVWSRTRISVLAFSTHSHICCNFSKTSADTNLRSKHATKMFELCKDFLPDSKSHRNIAAAMRKVRSHFLNNAGPGVDRFVILITDGFPQDFNETQVLKLILGVRMIVITTKQLSSALQLRKMAATIDYFISVADTGFEITLKEEIVSIVCIRHQRRVKRSVTCTDETFTATGGNICYTTSWVITPNPTDYYFAGEPPYDCYPEGETTVDIMKYNESAVQCTFKVTVIVHYCTALPNVDNGSRYCTGTASNVYGSTCYYYCNSGYILNGTNTVTCNLVLNAPEWSGNFPVCQVQHCAALPFFPYGSRICSGAEDNLYKSVCVHTCDSEFTIHGSSSVECLGTTSATGLWSTSFPVCHASTPPNLRTCRISVTDTQGTVTISGYQGNNTSCANQRNEWIKAQPRELYFALQADHNPNLSKPAGVSEVKAGVVGALIRLTKISSSGGEKVVREEVLDSTAFCQENISSTSPLSAGRMHVCEGNLILPSLNLNDGESLCADITAFSGGYYNLVDRNSSFQRQVVFEQVPTTKRVCFRYDSIKPVHCFDAGCNTEPLELSSRTTRTPSVRAIVRGWEDPAPPNGSLLAASQISTYKLEVHRVNVGLNNLTVENDAITQWTKEWSAVPGSSYDVNISLPKENPQLYAIVLEVHDHADNIGYARRLVMFDDSSSVKLLDSAPIWVTSADPVSNFTWQSNATREVCVDWRDRFYNSGMRDNDFLLPVDVDTTREIYSYYDQINGILPISGTNNVHGIVKFEFSWCDPGGNCSLMEEVSPVELQTTCFHENLQDCDVCEMQVKSTDIMGNTKEDSAHVNIDHSEPDVNIQESHGMIGPFGIHVCSSTELAKVVLKVQALDPHSGIRTLQWAIRLQGQTDNLYNGTIDVHRLQNGLNCTGKSNCYCPCVGSCELYEHELKFSYKEVAVSKNNTGVVHQSQYNIIITATNNAGLQFSKEVDFFIQTDSSSPALILEGMKRATQGDTGDDDMTVWITVGAVLGTCLLIGAYVSYLIWRRRKRAANQIGVSKGANNRDNNKSDQRRKRLRRGSLTTIAN